MLNNDMTDRASYNTVYKAHEGLSKSERMMVIDQLSGAYRRYEIEALQVGAIRQQLYRLYNDKLNNNQVISVLSRDFNMSMKGHNTQLSIRLGAYINEAFDCDLAGNHSEAVTVLLEAGLSLSYLTSDEVTTLLKAHENGVNPHAKAALSLLRQIVQYQETLFRSVIRMAAGVVKRAAWHNTSKESGETWKRLAGDVIEESDMIQTAIIAAKQAVLAYKPWLHEGQSFTSFVYNYVSGSLSKFINENTRVVSIPRKVLDRYMPLKAVIDNNPYLTQYDQYDYEAIANEVSEQKGTPYSAEEVEWLLLNVSRETASLDLEVIDNEGTMPVTLGDSLLNQDKSQEALMDQASLIDKMLEVIRDYSDTQEFTVIKTRWGGGEILSLDRTAKDYCELTGLAMNKSKVAQIERAVFKRLRELDDPRLRELLDVLVDSHGDKVTMIDVREGGELWCDGRRMVR